MSIGSQKVTIHNVAAEAGVSISTVSRVVNGLERVAPSTRRRVESAIKRLHFSPNTRAQALSRKCTNAIGLVVPDFQGQYFTMLMEGAHEEAQANAMHIIVLKAKGPEAKIDIINQLCFGGRVDAAIIMLDELHNDVLESIEGISNPLVVLDRDVKHWRFDNILVDNRLGGLEATEHLINEHGMENMFYVGGPENNVDTAARGQGFVDAMKKAGLDKTNKMFYCGQYSYDQGYDFAKAKLVPIIKTTGRCGIVAANDDIACGIADALGEHGVDVPNEVGIIGFDDSFICTHRQLKLSTMAMPVREIGRAAVRMVIGRLAEPEREPTKVMLKAKLVVRQSCGCNAG